MSERRVVIEEPDRTCLHGNTFGKCVSFTDPDSGVRCTGGSRRTLTEGQYVLIEKMNGEWPEWAEGRLSDPPLYELSPAAQQSLGMDGEAVKVKPEYILDALSDHTEGET